MSAAELGRRAEAMLTALGAISDEPGRVTRLFLSPAHKRAVDLVQRWMAGGGLATRVDALGTVHGLVPAATAGPMAAKRLLVGSHIDTIVDAGLYDGPLGVVAGILAAEEIRARGMPLPFGLEILAFGDEEGVRFPRTLTSSLAIAGAFDPASLGGRDKGGTTLHEALVAFGRDPLRVAGEAYRRESVLGYLEVHIEQGPVLDRSGESLAVVSSIAGQGRHRVRVAGEAGHAGTVPMPIRRDALAAAAEMVLAVEQAARESRGALVATVGEISARPGAINVIPGTAEFSLDVRAGEDAVRVEALAALRRSFQGIAEARNVGVVVETLHEKAATATSPALNAAIASAIRDVTGRTPREMISGAGHDGQAMAHLTEVGMIFVRCRNGISHNPAEYASPDDIGMAVEALIATIARLAKAGGAGGLGQ